MSKTKKIISVVLAVALVMAMATVAMVSASAAGKVYFNQPEGWGALNAHMWSSVGGTTEWPGLPMTDEGNGVWSIEIGDDYDMIIINDGANQTADCAMPEAGMIGTLSSEIGEVGGSGGQANSIDWAPYADAPVEEPTTTVAPVETTVAPVETTVAPVETTVAPVETTAVVEPTEAPTTVVATDDEEPTTVATGDEEPTTAVVEPTTVVTEPVEEPTTVVVEPTTVVVEPTTVVVEPTTVVEEPTTVVVEPTTVVEEPTTVVVEPTVAANDVIVVGGVEYTAKVGDVITYTANLTTPKAIENIQAYTTYDSAKLKLVSDASVMFPNMLGVVANPQDGVIYFNASEITKGFDFTAGQTLIYLQFEVLDNTYSEITTTIEEMVEFFGGDYVTGGEIVADGVVLTEALDVPVVEDDSSTATEEVTTTAAPTEEKTDATSATEDEKKPGTDVVPTGVAATIYVVLAVLAMAAAAVVVLRKKVNG